MGEHTASLTATYPHNKADRRVLARLHTHAHAIHARAHRRTNQVDRGHGCKREWKVFFKTTDVERIRVRGKAVV